MPPLAAIERFFERLFERPSARLFHTRVQPLQLLRRIEREMEAQRRATPDRTLAANRFVVHLHPDDLAGFGDLTERLADELADGALSFARAHHLALADRPRVDLLADPRIQRADIRVDARFEDPATELAAGGPGGSPNEPTSNPAAVPTDPTPTRVFAVPGRSTPRAFLTVTDPNGRTRSVTVGGGGLTIGRSGDNDLVARDGLVSRHHGRIAGRLGTLVYLDLGSSNGSRVNGESVSEVVLGVGDRLVVGQTTIVIEGVGAPD